MSSVPSEYFPRNALSLLLMNGLKPMARSTISIRLDGPPGIRHAHFRSGKKRERLGSHGFFDRPMIPCSAPIWLMHRTGRKPRLGVN